MDRPAITFDRFRLLFVNYGSTHLDKSDEASVRLLEREATPEVYDKIGVLFEQAHTASDTTAFWSDRWRNRPSVSLPIYNEEAEKDILRQSIDRNERLLGALKDLGKVLVPIVGDRESIFINNLESRYSAAEKLIKLYKARLKTGYPVQQEEVKPSDEEMTDVEATQDKMDDTAIESEASDASDSDPDSDIMIDDFTSSDPPIPRSSTPTAPDLTWDDSESASETPGRDERANPFADTNQPSAGVKIRNPLGTYGPDIRGPWLNYFTNNKPIPPTAAIAKSLDPSVVPAEGGWRGVMLTEGGFGKLTLWNRYNPQTGIVDRAVRKDTYLQPSYWEHETYWYGPKDMQIPMEFWTHRIVNKKSKYIAGMMTRRPEVDDRDRTYRLYFEYCPHRDLREMLNAFYPQDGDANVPKNFVLYVFRALVEAAIVMREGDGDQQIVHRDLKPDNVFLYVPDEHTFPIYPQPKLGDFGLAFLTHGNDPTNPWIWSDAGTFGYMAPEQISFIDSVTGQPVDADKILSPCNVWGIGAIVLSLIHHRELPEDEITDYTPGGREQWTVDESVYPIYSPELCMKVNECLNMNPAARPDLYSLSDWIVDKIQRECLNAYQGIGEPGADEILAYCADPRLGFAQMVAAEAGVRL